MNAHTVFEERREEFLAQLESAPDEKARIQAAQLVIEQIACVLAQQEQDDTARQRQQAVLAAVRRAPQMLGAAGARGEMVIAPAEKKDAKFANGKLGSKAIGAGILLLLAAFEVIDGQFIFACMQLIGSVLLLFGGGALPAAAARLGTAQARGVLDIDARTLLDSIADICRAADVCVSDLALLDKEAGAARLCGTADEATIDLLLAMLEAKASGRADAAARTLDLAGQYLRMMDMEAINYSQDTAAYFDVLPTLSGERTIRPALMKEGKLIRRGVAAKAMERSVGA